jgi:uncharacterized protein (TIGR03546 family)
VFSRQVINLRLLEACGAGLIASIYYFLDSGHFSRIVSSNNFNEERWRAMFIKWIAKIFIAINANMKPGQISGGIAFALLLAFIPLSNLLWVSILLLAFFIKINLTVVLVFAGIFGTFASLFDRPLNSIGLLTGYLPGVHEVLGYLNNIPLLPFFGFNNTLVLGGLVAGIVLFAPVYFLSNMMIRGYRKNVRDRLAKSNLVKKLLLIPVISKLVDAVRTAYSLYTG